MRKITCLVAAALASVAVPAPAQEQPSEEVQGPPAPPTAEEIEARARERLAASRTRAARPATQAGDIVVTADAPQEPDMYEDEPANDPASIRAPDLFGIPEGGVVVAKGCFIPPCPRPMPPLIDLKAIPEAPPGSDAARYAEAQ